VKRENKINIIIYTGIYLLGNYAKNLTRSKDLMSSPKCRNVEVINNPARPGLNHREVNCINYK
jgi:hypothetical protein